jgi:carbon starvation protein
MFEALFILTTVDAGTRVGRFMIQDMAGNIWRPFARTSWLPANIVASAIIVGAWGYFLYVGATDPLGGINQLFPLFGIANQLLAAVALTVGTTILIKMGKLKYAWVTALPLAWDAAVTLTASWYKIFSSDPKLGFFAQRAAAQDAYNAGETYTGASTLAQTQQIITNTTVDGVLSIIFALLIIIVIGDAARVWFGIIRGKKEPVMSEAPYEESKLDVDGNVLEPVGAGASSNRNE